MRYGPLHLFGNTASAVKLAQAMARPAARELLLEVVRQAHGDTGAAIDPRPSLPTVSPDPAAGAAVPSPAEDSTAK